MNTALSTEELLRVHPACPKLLFLVNFKFLPKKNKSLWNSSRNCWSSWKGSLNLLTYSIVFFGFGGRKYVEFYKTILFFNFNTQTNRTTGRNEVIWKQWEILPPVWNAKEMWTGKYAEQFRGRDIHDRTLLWNEISLRDRCSLSGGNFSTTKCNIRYFLIIFIANPFLQTSYNTKKEEKHYGVLNTLKNATGTRQTRKQSLTKFSWGTFKFLNICLPCVTWSQTFFSLTEHLNTH